MITRQTKKMGIVSLSLLVASAAALGWSYQLVNQLHADLKEVQTAVATHDAHAKNVANAQKMSKLAVQDENTLRKYLLTEAATVDLLTDLENLAAAGGVELTTESLKVVKEVAVPHVSLRLTGVGDQAAVNNLLLELEDLTYASWIENITWLRTEEHVQVDVNLNIVLLTP